WDFSSPLLLLWMNRFYIYLGCALGVTLWICVQVVIKKQVIRSQEKSVPGAPDSSFSLQKKQTHVSGVKIFYGSQTGTAKSHGWFFWLSASILKPSKGPLWWSCHWQDSEFRVFRDFVLSNKGGLRIVLYVSKAPALQEEEPCESSSEEELGTQDYQSLNSLVDVEDLGNIMSPMKKEKREKAQQEEKAGVNRNPEKSADSEGRAMITPALREALTKQGYQLIGSHSGVKLCRWTKSMLRGRGGCYKHTFYGIESHRCMEATPSLACANKCVFCWRHHTNPVGTEWRWKVDQPELILKEAIENHQNMIKQFKGVPGLKAERFEEGMEVKHCALSLVGEPIMYPEINRLLKLLHQHGISSFLVTNAQFPEEIRNLRPVTQLYVSVDASTKDSLKKIDRPLFKDFWQRFLDSLKALAAKQQRTVYRLTLVKCWNVEELQAYAELVSLGNPDFIEVKGVTYCGESAASSLTMANVPWHEEVVRFVQELVDLLPDYEIACEHEHSNCLLIGHKKFKISGEWWTWIDYSRFQELVLQYEESGGSKTFSASDYMARTPQWALFGARERGFDPKDTRYQRKNKAKDISGC
uniref:S-adenosyl-L-methionine-dependent tRNA 4-demethylwyosine synthase TYW1 n=1 Tax=Cricetulus griseus TaxID=10029 RepID=A0A8C2LGN9_CRIGR